jgi:subtilisin-like proprotein convertase family protein
MIRIRKYTCECWQTWLSLLLITTLLGITNADANSSYIPNDPLFRYEPSEPNFPAQWYLLNEAPPIMTFILGESGQDLSFSPVNIGIDSNVLGAWQRGYLGDGTIIGIIGITGIQGDHPDLFPNYDAQLSRNFSADPIIASAPQGPLELTDNHDTAVAGIAAAKGNNDIGITGAAPNATLTGLRIDNSDNSINPSSDQNYVDAYYWQSGVMPNGSINEYNVIHITNQSIARNGAYILESQEVIDALNHTSLNNTIHVFAAGNFRGTAYGNTNTQHRNSLNSVIAVSAVGSNGIYANYSNYGSSIFVSAPGAQTDTTGFLIRTTDRTFVDGFNPGSPATLSDYLIDDDYTSIFNGTSATAPIVSGALALARQASPRLNLRMAKHALVKSSNNLIDANDDKWQVNGAGIRFNPNYGFGLLDIENLINQTEKLAFVSNKSMYQTPIYIPDTDVFSFSITEAMLQEQNIPLQPLEAVEITLTFTSPNPAALTGILTSPSGTTSHFIYTESNHTSSAVNNFTWSYLANNFWQEPLLGDWQLKFSQSDGGDLDWIDASVSFNMGEAVMESETLNIMNNMSTDSVTINDEYTNLAIHHDASLSVRDDILLKSGVLTVNGEVRDLASSGLNRSALVIQRALLTGNGNIRTSEGVINVAGEINPGEIDAVGMLRIEGNYTQLTDASLTIELSNTFSDHIKVTQGSIILGGSLEIKILDETELAEGDRFVFLSSSGQGIYGEFDEVRLPLLDVPLYLAIEEEGDEYSIHVKKYKRQAALLSPLSLLLLIFLLVFYRMSFGYRK